MASLVSRHFGAEAVDRLADPLLSGIYGGDAAQLSARTVLPRLVEMETHYGSLTRGMLAAHRKMRARAAANGHATKPGVNPNADRPVFTTLRGGMQQLVDAIRARLDWAAVRLSTPVNALERTADGWMVHSLGTAEFYDSVIMASPGVGVEPVALRRSIRRWVRNWPVFPTRLRSRLTSCMTRMRWENFRRDSDFWFPPASAGRCWRARFRIENFWARRRRAGRCCVHFLGGSRNEALLAESDAGLVAIVRHELIDILGDTVRGIGLDPIHTQVTRWRRAMAQYAVGHQERIERINDRVSALPGLRLAGNAYDGIGVPDCIRLGRRAAAELIQAATGMSV